MRHLESEILDLLRKDAVTPDEVAQRLGVSWATANGHLLKLVGDRAFGDYSTCLVRIDR